LVESHPPHTDGQVINLQSSRGFNCSVAESILSKVSDILRCLQIVNRYILKRILFGICEEGDVSSAEVGQVGPNHR
jgi:hypothetical protein